MRKNKIEVYIHLVWATYHWQPLINAAMDRQLYRVISHEVQQCDCAVLALGGIETHCHLLTKTSTAIRIADLVKQVKGASSRFVNDALCPTDRFQWQGCYGAFSVSRWDVEMIIHDIRNQQRHHQENSLMAEFEETGFLD